MCFFYLIAKDLFVLEIFKFFGTFSRVASNFCNENSRTIQENFKNISILFKNISDSENIITIGFKGFFKELNVIITYDKFHEIQMSTRTKLRKS